MKPGLPLRPDMSHDWRDVPLPPNIECGPDCFLQSSHVFGLFRSKREPGLQMGRGSGIYSQSQLVVGEGGRIRLGNYACINSATLRCESEIEIGAHCLVAWDVVISDCSVDLQTWNGSWKRADGRGSDDLPPGGGHEKPVVLKDNVWIGFGAVIQPGVTIGKGSIVGSKTVISEDVPPYVVVVGSPPRIVRALDRP